MRTIERLLIRRLHGEASEAELAELERLLETDPRVDELCRMEAAWQDLEAPPAQRPDADFRACTVAAARREVAVYGPPLRLRAAAAALVAGLSLGLVLDHFRTQAEPPLDLPMDEKTLELFAPPPTLAESWGWSEDAVSDFEGPPGVSTP